MSFFHCFLGMLTFVLFFLLRFDSWSCLDCSMLYGFLAWLSHQNHADHWLYRRSDVDENYEDFQEDIPWSMMTADLPCSYYNDINIIANSKCIMGFWFGLVSKTLCLKLIKWLIFVEIRPQLLASFALLLKSHPIVFFRSLGNVNSCSVPTMLNRRALKNPFHGL